MFIKNLIAEKTNGSYKDSTSHGWRFEPARLSFRFRARLDRRSRNRAPKTSFFCLSFIEKTRARQSQPLLLRTKNMIEKETEKKNSFRTPTIFQVVRLNNQPHNCASNDNFFKKKFVVELLCIHLFIKSWLIINSDII